jgi:hypothetical protein
MPPGTAWKCRFNHVDVFPASSPTEALLARHIHCSSDGWRTQAGDSANASSGKTAAGEIAVAGAVSLFEEGQYVGEVEMLPCVTHARWVCKQAPELP